MLRGRPLAWLAAGFLAGAAAARVTDAPLALLSIAILSAAVIIRRRHPVPLLLLGLALGGLRQEWAETRERFPAVGDRVEGIVQGPPRITRTLEDPDGETGSDGSFVVGRVQVRFFGRTVPLLGGERVVVRGELRRPKPATNPGQFDYAAFLDRQGIDAVMTLGDLQVLEGPSFAGRARGGARALLDRGLRPEVAAFLGAIVLGRREAVADELIEQFQKSGTAHLLAISGQNLVIVLVSLWVVLTALGIRGRLQIVLLLALLGAYVLLTGMQVSVVRSYLMIAVFLGADLAWRKRDALSALGAAAILICAIDPAQVADVGFQLSFAAVLGLSTVAPLLHGMSDAGGWLGNRVRLAIGVSVAAWLATAPLILENFNLLTPGIVLANLLLVPLLSLEFVIGLVHLVLAPLGAGTVSGWAANSTFDLIRACSGFVTALPFSHAYGAPPGPILIAAYYAALAGWAAWCRRRPAAWKPYLALLLAVPLGLTGPLRHRAPEGLLLAVLDVGRGSCTYLEWPDGRNAVVDCGSLNARDPGATIAAKYLWHRGVTRLDTLALSHPDLDHVNGARTLIERFGVRRLLVTRAFQDARWPPGVEVVTVERVDAPLTWGPFEILGPPVWEKFGREVPANETSLVLRTGGVLLPGDVEERGVEELLTVPDLRARVFVLPHHGKFHRRHEELARRVGAEVTVASAPEGYYSPRVAAALSPPPLVTGTEGAIELELLPNVVRRIRR